MMAECGPADRSTVIVTSFGLRSTLARSSPGAPCRQTQIPLIATFSRSGWKTASVVPTALSTRPQLGSSPPMAHLSRLFRATDRPTVTASASEAAPTTSMVIILFAPSASSWSCRARSAHTSVRARVNSVLSGATPLAPLAISSTVSLVDMQPSVSSRSNVVAVAVRSAASSWAGSRSASVVSTQSMVARPGASIAAPLAIPPMEYPSGRRKAIFTTVSVVLIASAAARPPAREASATAALTPGSSLSIGSRSPIRPVEQTAISPAESSIAAARCSAVACVSWKPSGPVQALAPPELSTTARTRPPLTTWRDHLTGAACTRLLVKTAAAARDGPSLMTTATSRSPDAFSPATTPAARKPSGAVTLIRPPRWRSESAFAEAQCSPIRSQARSWGYSVGGQASRLREAEHEVGDLHGLAGRALAEVVGGGDHDGAARVLVGGDLHVRAVGAVHRGGRRPLARGQQVHERAVAVSVGERGAQRAGRVPGARGLGGEPGRAGGEDAPRHRGQRRGEGQRHGSAAGDDCGQGLLDLRGVPVGAAHLVGGHAADDL